MIDKLHLITKSPRTDSFLFKGRKIDGIYTEEVVLKHVVGLLKLSEVFSAKTVTSHILFDKKEGFDKTTFFIDIYNTKRKPEYQLYISSYGRSLKGIIDYVNKYIAIMDSSKVENLITGVLSMHQKNNILTTLTEREFSKVCGSANISQYELMKRIVDFTDLAIHNEAA